MPDPLRKYLLEGETIGARYRFASAGRTPQGTTGAQLARSAGESMEFMEHRDYQPGDDLRKMNWSAYARSDKLVVKVLRQEVTPHFDLVIDGSRSMNLAGTEKLRATLGLAASLAAAAENSHYSRHVYLTRSGCDPVQGGPQRPSAWSGLAFESTQSPEAAFKLLPPRCRPHGVRVIVSDFLWLGNPLSILNLLADKAATTLAIQVLAKEDAEPPELGNFRLVDSESGESAELYVDAAGRDRYRQNLARHQQAWRQAARQVGANFVSFIAEDLCQNWDLSPLVQMEILTLS